MAPIKYIGGTLGELLEGEPLASNSLEAIRQDIPKTYVLRQIEYAAGELIIPLYTANPMPEVKVEKLKPILGLGLRDAFMNWQSRLSYQSSCYKIHTTKLNKDVSSLTPLEENMFENKSGSAVLAIAGISLMGPVGALAGLAAKKKVK